MSVKRYTYHTIPYEHYMGEKGEKEYAPAGDYVRWEDYAALLAKYEKAVELGSNLRIDLSVFHNERFNRKGESPAFNRPTIKAWMEAFEPQRIDQ